MAINYESAWKQLKTFVSDMEGYSKPYSSIGFKAVLLKMEELEKALTSEDIMTPKDETSATISNILHKYNLSTDDTALPDIKIGDFVVERSKLPKFTAEEFSLNVFAETAKILGEQNLYTDVIKQFVDDRTKDVDRIVFDCFQQYLGCKKADDVFVILTSPAMFHNYNDILPCINAKLAREVGPLGSPSGMHCIKLGEMTEPATGTHEMLETLRTRWEEIYNEN